MLRKIRANDDPVLREKARAVKEVDDHIRKLLDDMVETMRHAKGVGLAATQIGLLRRVLVADIGEGVVELVNPELLYLEGEAIGAEGCLSLPGIRYQVPRALEIGVKGWGRHGQAVEFVAKDLLARVIQHELDHLDGVLIKDRGTAVEVANG